ncbi:MAG: immunoglobulin domain-containing protein [Roseibacillus sp.]
MKHKTILTTLVVGLLGAHLQAVEVANAAADYQTAPGIGAGLAPTAPPAGWEYVYSDAASGGTEVPLTADVGVGNQDNNGFGSTAGGSGTPNVLGSIAGTATNYGLFGTAHAGVVGDDLLIHPGNNAGTAYIIVRYTVSAADITNGDYATITGSFRDLQGNSNTNSNNSIVAQVLLNDSSLFSATGELSRLYNDGTLPSGVFNVETAVAEGDTISFVAFNNGHFASDETALVASIDLGDAPLNDPPTITADPGNQDLFIGEALDLAVSVTGTQPFTYQWRKDLVDISGATSATFNIASVIVSDAASYDCVITNAFGTDTSLAAIVTVSVEPPTITTQPASQTLIEGETLTLTVIADGTDEPFAYQWAYDDGSGFEDIVGATSSTFTIASVVESDSGSYDCFVSNSAGDAFSDPADIVVRTNDPPVANAPGESTPENTPLILTTSALATDADGDVLTITGADGVSVNGATISFTPTEVGYFPAAGTTTDDTFTVDVTDGFETVTVTITVDVFAISAGKVAIADAALDYVAAAGGLVEDLTVLPSGWSYFGSTAASGAALTPLTAGRVGNQNPAADYQGFVGVSSNGTASVYGTETDEAAEFEIFANGDLNDGVIGTDLLVHPGAVGNNDEFLIIRYTVSADDVNGQVPNTGAISGNFRELIIGGNAAVDSVSSEVFLNGVSQFAALGNQSTPNALTQAEGTFNITGLTFAEGDTIDFVVGANGHLGADETALQAAICVDFDPNLVVEPQEAICLETPDGSGANFVFTYTRADTAAATETHVFEYSETLTSGSFTQVSIDTGDPQVSLGTPSGGEQEVTITISKISLTNDDKLFGRVVVTPN